MAVNFYLDKRTDKSGDSAIRVSITMQGLRYITSSGLKIAPSKWNAGKQQVKQGCTNSKGITYSAINKKLLQITKHFIELENQCVASGRVLNEDVLKQELASVTGNHPNTPRENKISTGFYGVYDIFVLDMSKRNEWTHATWQKFQALKNHLQDWDANLTFKKFSEEGLIDFVQFLKGKCDMRNITISKQLGYLKWFLRWATRKGYNDERAFLTFSPRLRVAPKQVIFLSWEELMRVYNYDIPANGKEVKLTSADGKEYTKEMHDAGPLAKTRDIFCFCCFTSLRYSDAANLKWSNISGNVMTITTVKTADTIRIELNKYAQAILSKYRENKQPDGKVLPQISNQKMNQYLKELCEFCEINEPITQTYYKGNTRYDETEPKYELIGSHAARRTFICNALMLGIPPEVVMKWTGHSDYKSMKPYIDVTDAAKANAMKLFDML